MPITIKKALPIDTKFDSIHWGMASGFMDIHFTEETVPLCNGSEVKLKIMNGEDTPWEVYHDDDKHEHENTRLPFWASRWPASTFLGEVLSRMANPETYDLVTERRVMDLGSGTGYIGIVATKCGASQVLLADKQTESIRLSAANMELNGIKLGEFDWTPKYVSRPPWKATTPQKSQNAQNMNLSSQKSPDLQLPPIPRRSMSPQTRFRSQNVLDHIPDGQKLKKAGLSPLPKSGSRTPSRSPAPRSAPRSASRSTSRRGSRRSSPKLSASAAPDLPPRSTRKGNGSRASNPLSKSSPGRLTPLEQRSRPSSRAGSRRSSPDTKPLDFSIKLDTEAAEALSSSFEALSASFPGAGLPPKRASSRNSSRNTSPGSPEKRRSGNPSPARGRSRKKYGLDLPPTPPRNKRGAAVKLLATPPRSGARSLPGSRSNSVERRRQPSASTPRSLQASPSPARRSTGRSASRGSRTRGQSQKPKRQFQVRQLDWMHVDALPTNFDLILGADVINVASQELSTEKIAHMVHAITARCSAPKAQVLLSEADDRIEAQCVLVASAIRKLGLKCVLHSGFLTKDEKSLDEDVTVLQIGQDIDETLFEFLSTDSGLRREGYMNDRVRIQQEELEAARLAALSPTSRRLEMFPPKKEEEEEEPPPVSLKPRRSWDFSFEGRHKPENQYSDCLQVEPAQ